MKQLLDYAGKGRREMRPIDIGQVMKDALAIVQASVSKKIKITRDIPANSPILEGDVGQIQQLILNLVLNGAEAIGENHGEVSIRVRVRDVAEAELSKNYAPFPMPPGAYTEIQVSDNGIGMDERTLQQIFDPFFTTKFMGRGLGLAAALGIVRSHGGGIAVESHQGKGTTFTVLLPAEQETASENLLTLSEAITETARGEGLVLVVDDEVAIRSMIQHVLEDLGYTVVTAEHGAQALELFDNIPDEVKLVLLDVNMPVLDGGETAVALRERKPDIPILVMSGIADEDALRALRDHANLGLHPEAICARSAVSGHRHCAAGDETLGRKGAPGRKTFESRDTGPAICRGAAAHSGEPQRVAALTGLADEATSRSASNCRAGAWLRRYGSLAAGPRSFVRGEAPYRRTI